MMDARLAVVEMQMTKALERLETIEDIVLELRLDKARYEWVKRVLWLAIGALPVALATIAVMARYSVSAARLP